MPEIETFTDCLGVENWNCPECDLANTMRETECGICGFERPSDLTEQFDGESDTC